MFAVVVFVVFTKEDEIAKSALSLHTPTLPRSQPKCDVR